MPEPIRFDLEGNRELLIMVAQNINNLSEKTTELCNKIREHEIILTDNRDKITAHELKLVEILANNSEVAKTTAQTLKEMHALLDKQVANDLIIDQRFQARERYGKDNRKMIIGLWGLVITGLTALAYFVWRNVTRGF
jgi:hypothetical protein